MHEILERFIGRYHVWRDRRLQHNPLDAPALIAVISIVQIAYNLLARHNFSWRAAFLTVINVAFRVLYVRKWRWAWLILPIWGAMILLQVPSLFDLASRYPPRVTVVSACMAFALGGWIHRVGLWYPQTLLLLHRMPIVKEQKHLTKPV